MTLINTLTAVLAFMLVGCNYEVVVSGRYICKPTNPIFYAYVESFVFDTETADIQIQGLAAFGLGAPEVMRLTDVDGVRHTLRVDDIARWDCGERVE